MGCGGATPAEPDIPQPEPENKPRDPYSPEAIQARLKQRAEEDAANPKPQKEAFKMGAKHKINRAGAIGSKPDGLVRNSEMEKIRAKMSAAKAAKAVAHAVTHPHMPHFPSFHYKKEHPDRHGGAMHASIFIARLKSMKHTAAHALHLDHPHGHRSSKAGSAPATTTV